MIVRERQSLVNTYNFYIYFSFFDYRMYAFRFFMYWRPRLVFTISNCHLQELPLYVVVCMYVFTQSPLFHVSYLISMFTRVWFWNH
jgi:hypothetical protein